MFKKDMYEYSKECMPYSAGKKARVKSGVKK